VLDRFTHAVKKMTQQPADDAAAVKGSANLPEITTISDFAKLPVDYRLTAIMKYGDTKPVDPDHFKYFEFAIVSDPDTHVKLAALKRIHLFKGHPDLLPMITAIRQTNQYGYLEPYFSMALHRLDLITLEEFERIINQQ
jgi:hypothetical protein